MPQQGGCTAAACRAPSHGYMQQHDIPQPSEDSSTGAVYVCERGSVPLRPSPSSSAVSLPQMMRSLPLNFFRGISNVGLMIMVSESIHRYHSISGCSCNQHPPFQYSAQPPSFSQPPPAITCYALLYEPVPSLLVQPDVSRLSSACIDSNDWVPLCVITSHSHCPLSGR